MNLVFLDPVESAAAGGRIAAGTGGIHRLGSVLFDLKTFPAVLFYVFYGCFLEVAKCLAIHDDLYAMTGINLVAIADLVIQ